MSAIRLGLVAAIAIVSGGCITITIDPPPSATPVAGRPLPAFSIAISPPPVPTLSPPTLAPTKPSPVPATPTPAPTASPPTAPPPIGQPTSEEALVASMLLPTDVDPTAEWTGVDVITEAVDLPAFALNGGMRRASQRFDLDDGLTINDFRYQFPTAEAAASFLDAEASTLGETEGLFGADEEDPPIELGDDTRYYVAHIEILVIQDTFNYLIRVENVVAKVWIGGSPDVIDEDEAAGIAQAAANRMVAALEAS